jgi:hypothetical protein
VNQQKSGFINENSFLSTEKFKDTNKFSALTDNSSKIDKFRAGQSIISLELEPCSNCPKRARHREAPGGLEPHF